MYKNLYKWEETLKAKGILGKYDIISEIWRRRFAPSPEIGNCTNLFRKVKPKSYEDFCVKYFEYAEQNKNLPIKERGLTYDEFMSLANDYRTASNIVLKKEHPIELYINDALCHIITETYDGKLQEVKFMEYLESNGFKCEYFEGNIDATYGVDIKVTSPNNGKVFAIQIKPLSFFKSTRSDVHKDRIGMIEKYHKCINDLGIKTYYVIYSKDRNNGAISWIKNKNNGGYKFKLNELFEYQIDNVYNTMSSKKIDGELVASL